MHLDEGQLQQLVDDELPLDGEWLSDHVAHCASCRQRLVDARAAQSRLFALLGTLDHPRPAIAGSQVIERARRRANPWIGKAAAVLLAGVLAGVAYAAPGSPLRSVVAAIFGGKDARVEQPPPAAGSTGMSRAGISVDPGRHMIVTFSGTQTGGQLTVSLTDRSEISIESIGTGPSFTSGSGTLLVERAGPGEFALMIPRTAQVVEVRVDSLRVFRKEGPRIESSGIARGNGWLIPFAPGR